MQFLRTDLGRRHAIAAVLAAIAVAPILWAFYWAFLAVDTSGYIFDATGPLTLAEVEANFLSRMEIELTESERQCVIREVEERASAAGDPQTLDPVSVEMLPQDHWDTLDSNGKRLILTQAIVTRSLFVCR